MHYFPWFHSSGCKILFEFRGASRHACWAWLSRVPPWLAKKLLIRWKCAGEQKRGRSKIKVNSVGEGYGLMQSSYGWLEGIAICQLKMINTRTGSRRWLLVALPLSNRTGLPGIKRIPKNPFWRGKKKKPKEAGTWFQPSISRQISQPLLNIPGSPFKNNKKLVKV